MNNVFTETKIYNTYIYKRDDLSFSYKKKLKKSYIIYIVLLLKGKLYERYFGIKVFGLGYNIFVRNSMAIEQLIDKLSFHTCSQHLNMEQLLLCHNSILNKRPWKLPQLVFVCLSSFFYGL